MNFRYTIAQPCFCRVRKGQAPIIKPNLRKRFVLFDELVAEREVTSKDGDAHWYYDECIEYTRFKEPMGPFTSVFKGVYDTESWKDWGYYLVGDIDLEGLYRTIKSGYIWPFRHTMAFGSEIPKDAENLVSYSDTHIITGINKPRRCKLLRRRDR